MKKLAEKIASLKARQTEINNRQAAIEKECEEKHSGEFTPELNTEYLALGKEYDQNAAELATAEASLNALNARQSRGTIDTARPRQTDGSVSGDIGPNGDGSHEPRIAFKLPAGVRRTGSLANFKGSVDGRSAEERAYRFGHFLLARATLCLPGRFAFNDSVRFCNDQFGHDKMAAMSTNDSNGSHYLVPDEFGSDLINLRERYGVARRLFKYVPMLSDTRRDPRRTQGLTAYFTAEGGAGTASDLKHKEVLLSAKEVMVLTVMSNALNSAAVVTLGDDVAGEISQALALKEDQCGFIGDGSSTYGGIQGVCTALKAAAGSPTTTSAGGVVVGAGNAYSELTMADFHNVVGVLPQYADNEDTCWAVHKTFYATVMQRLENAAGGASANEIREGNRKPRPLFLGYPVEFVQVMPSTAANSQVCALLGNFKLGASFGDRQQETLMLSEHATVNSQSVFERNQIAIRGTESIDINASYGVGDSSTAGPIVGLQTLNS